MWAGSFDTTIYIIDVVSYTANKQLVEHDDIVSDITTDEDSRYVKDIVYGDLDGNVTVKPLIMISLRFCEEAIPTKIAP